MDPSCEVQPRSRGGSTAIAVQQKRKMAESSLLYVTYELENARNRRAGKYGSADKLIYRGLITYLLILKQCYPIARHHIMPLSKFLSLLLVKFSNFLSCD